MSTPIAVDIETVGVDWGDLDPPVQDMLLQRARTEEERDAVPQRLGLHPGTGRIVAIGFWRPTEDRGGVMVEGQGAAWQDFSADGKIFRGSEVEMLAEFWQRVRGPDTVVTFNGRQFDGPFLMIRSVMLGVPPSRNLVPYRYSFREHADLAEVLTFFRARSLDSFDFWCHQMDIKSSKGEMSGKDVQAAYEAGRLDDIARYCLEDARATAQLYNKLRDLIRVLDPKAGV